MNKSIALLVTFGALVFFGCKDYPHTHPIPPQLPVTAETKIPPINLGDTIPEVVELRQATAFMITIGFAQVKSNTEDGVSLKDEKRITALTGPSQVKLYGAGHKLHPHDDAGSSEYVVGQYVSTARAQNESSTHALTTRGGETIAVSEKNFDEALAQLHTRNKTVYEAPFSGYKRVFILEEPIREQTLLASEPLKRYFVTIAVNGISSAPDAAAYFNTLPGGYNVELEVTKEIYESGDKWPPPKETQQFLHPAYFSEISGVIKVKHTKIDQTYRVVQLPNEAFIIVPRSALE